MEKVKQQHHLDGLLILLLFGVFAACILLVLLTGADVYQRLTRRDDGAYDRRTAAQYIATKVRQSDGAGTVSVAAFGSAEALLLTEEIEGEIYVTRVYYYDGYIRELFSEAGTEMAPEDGWRVLKAQDMTLMLEDRLLSVEITTGNGEDIALALALRGGEGAAP